jgi:hypothetical protein
VKQEIGALFGRQLEAKTRDFGRQVGATARNVHALATELENDQLMFAASPLVEGTARALDRVALYFEQSDLDTLLTDADHFGRAHPWTMGFAALSAGFAVSRLVKSAAQGTGKSFSATAVRPRDTLGDGIYAD